MSVNLVGTCTVNKSVTPIRLELRCYFSQLLKKNREKQSHPTDRHKVKPRFYGEALTLDDVFERLLEEEETKKKLIEEKKEESKKRQKKKISQRKKCTGKVAQKKSKNRSKTKEKKESLVSSSSCSEDDNENICKECHVKYQDDDELWMG